MIEENWAIECADCAMMLGNDFSIGTYAYAGKRIYRIPVPVSTDCPEPTKDFESVRRTFVWFGSRGFVHKGLDLVLEAFSEMPQYKLLVCGPIDRDPVFQKAYHRELYQQENIETIGWVDVASETFKGIANKALAVVYPSCAEGQSGGVITCMSTGMIPVVSNQSGVDVPDGGGLVLDELSVEEIKRVVDSLAQRPPAELSAMATKAWAYVQENHTKERYVARYREVLEDVLGSADKLTTRTIDTRPVGAIGPVKERRPSCA